MVVRSFEQDGASDMASPPARQERRLVAILAADVEGYSRLMGLDEARTMRSLTERRARACDLIADHQGRVVNTAGDSILAEFGSAVDAVECAVAIQRTIAEANQEIEPARQMWLRIGIHIGDVLLKGNELFGDGVNTAARLQAMAEAGGICISRAVHDQVRNKLALAFTDLGPQAMKNIADPVQVWRIEPGGPTPGASSIARSTQAVLRRPAIAVLPFTNMSDDREQEFFADGLAEDLITELSRTGALLVIARNSTFSYKGRAENVCRIARELGAQYVLEGSVRKAGLRIRVTAQLIDGATSVHLWAERYDRDLTDVFAVQDEITSSIVKALALNLSPDFDKRMVGMGTSSVEAYGLLLKGRELNWQLTKSSNIEAKALLERAIALDPGFARAYGTLAQVLILFGHNGWSDDPAADERRTLELGETAIRLNAFDPQGYWVLAAVFVRNREYERALTLLQRALALDPSFHLAYVTLASALVGLGHYEEALRVLDTSARIDPHGPGLLLHHRARALFSSRPFR